MSTEETLRRWVRDHHVQWDLLPLLDRGQRVQVQVGYQFELFARHAAGEGPGIPCPECQDLNEKLGTTAAEVTPGRFSNGFVRSALARRIGRTFRRAERSGG